jgi:hypothetical protein
MAQRRHLSWFYALAAQIVRAGPDSRFSRCSAAPELRRRWRRKHANRIELAVFDNESLDLSGASSHKDAHTWTEAHANPDTEADEIPFPDRDPDADADRYSNAEVHATMHSSVRRANSETRNLTWNEHRRL